MIKMYFKGSSGIEKPVDVDGKEIREGDILTFEWFGTESTVLSKMPEKEREEYMHRPVIKVKRHPNEGLFGESIDPDNYLYMHDFRFKYTKNLTTHP